jgi:hypothetical protein
MSKCSCKSKPRRKLIHHEQSRYNVGQAKKHLKHHKGVKLLRKQIESQEERSEKD